MREKNARRIIVYHSTDSVSASLTDTGDEYDDSVFDEETLDSSITSDAEEVGSPDSVSEAEKVYTDPRPMPGMATGIPGHNIGAVESDLRTAPKKQPNVKATEVLRLRDGPEPKHSWLDSDGFTRLAIQASQFVKHIVRQ